MTPAQTIDILRQLHDWLRGGTQWAPTRGAEAVETAIEMIERLEVAESARRDDYQNWMTALDRNAELLAKLEAAEKERDDIAQQLVQSEQGKRKISKECDTYKAAYNEWIAKTEWMQDELTCGKLPAKYLGMHYADGLKAEIDALRFELSKQQALTTATQHIAGVAQSRANRLQAKVEAMEKQAPFDADSDVFRSAFEAALKAGNWPATRQGDGYRSPSTQIAWRIAFSTVNRLKLYLAPGAKGETK